MKTKLVRFLYRLFQYSEVPKINIVRRIFSLLLSELARWSSSKCPLSVQCLKILLPKIFQELKVEIYFVLGRSIASPEIIWYGFCERWKNSNQTYQSWLAYTLGEGSLSKPEEWGQSNSWTGSKISLENREYIYWGNN